MVAGQGIEASRTGSVLAQSTFDGGLRIEIARPGIGAAIAAEITEGQVIDERRTVVIAG